MLIVVASAGLAFLIGLAIAVGVESSAHHEGWRGVAEARHSLSERSKALDEREQELAKKHRKLRALEGELAAAMGSQMCPVCELRRQRGNRLND